MQDVNEIIQDAGGNIINAMCKLSVISSVDADTFNTIADYRNLIYGIIDIVDMVNSDLYKISLSFEG